MDNPKIKSKGRIELLLSKDLSKALEEVEGFIKKYPTEPYGYLLKGHVMSQLNPYDNTIIEYLNLGVFYSLRDKNFRDLSTIFNEIGLFYKTRLKMTECIKNFYLSIEYSKPNDKSVLPLVHFNLATSLLAIGDYITGFEEYKWLYINRDNYLRHFQQPFWRGEVMKNKVIYVHNEQAFGDLMFFFRYVKKLKPYFKTIILEVPEKLYRFLSSSKVLLRDSYNKEQNSEKDEKIILYKRVEGSNPGINFDVHTHYAILPYHFKTTLDTIPTDIIPYFRAEPELSTKWQKYFNKEEYRGKFKIAINWCGRPTNEHEHKRQIPLEKFLILTQLSNIQLFSIQKFHGLDQLKEEYPIVNLDPDLDKTDSYLDTAALMDHVDLTITSDTSIAHLVGCLGKKVWVLLPYEREWRWMVNRTTSPWYPNNMRLFIQPTQWDWDSVFKEVVQELELLIVS